MHIGETQIFFPQQIDKIQERRPVDKSQHFFFLTDQRKSLFFYSRAIGDFPLSINIICIFPSEQLMQFAIFPLSVEINSHFFFWEINEIHEFFPRAIGEFHNIFQQSIEKMRIFSNEQSAKFAIYSPPNDKIRVFFCDRVTKIALILQKAIDKIRGLFIP